MTKRQNILVSCWEAQFRTCACGRCGCAAPDPVAWARTILGCWSRQSLAFAEQDEESAKRYDEIANDYVRRCGRGKYRHEPDAETLERTRGDARKRRESARTLRHQGILYGRLSRGEPPFQPSARAT
jgi:hypothetical protein